MKRAACCYITLVVVGIALGYWWAKRKPQGDVLPEVEFAEGKVARASAIERWAAAKEWPQHARDDARAALAQSIPSGDVEQCLGDLTFPGDLFLAQRILIQLAKTDGARAMQLFDALPVAERAEINKGYVLSSQKVYVQCRVLEEWAEHDIEAAVGYAEERAAGAPKWSHISQAMLQMLIAPIAKGDVDRAVAFAATHGITDIPAWIAAKAGERYLERAGVSVDARSRAEAASYAFYNRALEDPAAALAEMLATPPGTDFEAKLSWTNGLFFGEQLMALRSHTMADRYETEDWSSKPVRRVPWEELQRWATREPREAVAWTDDLPEKARGHFRVQALVGAALNDPDWAVGEIDQLSPARRDQAMVAIAPEWALRDPAAAQAWAESIGDPALRAQVLEAIPSR